MVVKETEIMVEAETATDVEQGTIMTLELRVSVSHHHKNGPSSIGFYDVQFERRNADEKRDTDGEFKWTKITDAGDSDWFGATHCAVVLEAAKYVEDHYDEPVDTRQISSPN